MLFFSDRARNHLAPIGDYIGSKLAKSQSDSDIEMQAAKQAHYIEWCRLHYIHDPCGSEPGFERVVAVKALFYREVHRRIDMSQPVMRRQVLAGSLALVHVIKRYSIRLLASTINLV